MSLDDEIHMHDIVALLEDTPTLLLEQETPFACATSGARRPPTPYPARIALKTVKRRTGWVCPKLSVIATGRHVNMGMKKHGARPGMKDGK